MLPFSEETCHVVIIIIVIIIIVYFLLLSCHPTNDQHLCLLIEINTLILCFSLCPPSLVWGWGGSNPALECRMLNQNTDPKFSG